MPEHGVVAWLVIGLVLGLGAKFLSGGFDVSGCLVSLVCGVAGAFAAGWLTATLFAGDDFDGHYALIGALFGGFLVLWVASILTPRGF